MKIHQIPGLLAAILLVACGPNSQSESTTSEQDAVSSPNPPPNILLIVADDLGYSDIAPFGGEIETPHLSALAEQGIRFSRFYTASACAPTRSMLLTGVDNHQAGIGAMSPAPNQKGKPGYEDVLNQRVAALPNLLRDAGYHTYMTGKWHLGHEDSQRPAARGFDNSFALMQGGASHFSDATGPFGMGKSDYYEQDQRVESLPEGFYSSHFYTDRMLEQIESNRQDGRPFFGYLAYTAPHFPLQAPESIIDKYRGRYSEGFNKLKQRRFEAMKRIGLIPNTAPISQPNPESENWTDLSDQEQAFSMRMMEIYAAMVDDMDQQIGRVIAYLKDTGQYKNTVIIFISDNGADPSSDRVGLEILPRMMAKADNSPENMGRKGSLLAYGHNWAEASMGAFKRYKAQAAEGGIRVPAIISWPAKISTPSINHGLAGVIDIVPTALDLAMATHPGGSYKGREVIPPQGQSLAPVLTGERAMARDKEDYIGSEHWSSRAIIQQEWKLLGLYDAETGLQDWELYKIDEDPGETLNLASEEAAKFSQMVDLWDRYVAENGVIIAQPGVPLLMRASKDG